MVKSSLVWACLILTEMDATSLNRERLDALLGFRTPAGELNSTDQALRISLIIQRIEMSHFSLGCHSKHLII